MALDESKDTDEVIKQNGFIFVVDKMFMERAQSIKVDYSVYGFKLDCGIDFSAAASGCSGCGTTSNCCS